MLNPMYNMLTANQAKQLTVQSFTQELEPVELEIKEAAKKGLNVIKLSTGIWHVDKRYSGQMKCLSNIIREHGYKLSYSGVNSEVTEISW